MILLVVFKGLLMLIIVLSGLFFLNHLLFVAANYRTHPVPENVVIRGQLALLLLLGSAIILILLSFYSYYLEKNNLALNNPFYTTYLQDLRNTMFSEPVDNNNKIRIITGIIGKPGIGPKRPVTKEELLIIFDWYDTVIRRGLFNPKDATDPYVIAFIEHLESFRPKKPSFFTFR